MLKHYYVIPLLFASLLSPETSLSSFSVTHSAQKSIKSIKRNISKQWYYITGAAALCVGGYFVSRMIKHRESPLINTKLPSTQEETELTTSNNDKFKKQPVIIPKETSDDENTTNLELNILLSEDDINLSDFKAVLNDSSDSDENALSQIDNSSSTVIIRDVKNKKNIGLKVLLKPTKVKKSLNPPVQNNKPIKPFRRKKKSKLRQALETGD